MTPTMIIAPSAFSLPRPLVGSAIAIGNFDGVHRGHQALVAAALAEVAGTRRDAVALTFDPHPGTVVHRLSAPALLTTLPRRLELLAELGPSATVVQPFDAAFSQPPAQSCASHAARSIQLPGYPSRRRVPVLAGTANQGRQS